MTKTLNLLKELYNLITKTCKRAINLAKVKVHKLDIFIQKTTRNVVNC
jgi:hypothetical protein